MDHSQHLFVTLTALLFCTCAVTSLPAAAAQPPEELQGLLSNLFTNVVSKLKTSHTHDASQDAWPVADSDSESSQPLNAGSASANSNTLSALKHGFLGFNKRQGYYDYGLGGGRFGKRYYGDYGIGGGRFGRDVDHVDIADTNDSAQ